MSYLVMECHPGYVILLDEEGRFLKAANFQYEVGQTVYEPVVMKEPPEKQPNTIRWISSSYLGDKLKGSWNIHTHPPDSTQFSFSTDADIPAFFEDGSAVMEAVDYKCRYRFERPEGITWETWEKVRHEVYEDRLNLFGTHGILVEDYEENIQHLIIQETCNRLGINSYRRWLL